MKEPPKGEQQYHLPGDLNLFQLDLYRHLIEWKWRHITKDPGRSHGRSYDAILPDIYAQQEEWPHLYPAIRDELKSHLRKNPFRIHQHFYHMASSQAANINLFLPILRHPSARTILRTINPDVAELATDVLDHGYCLEYWGWNLEDHIRASGNTGPLADKSAMAGTDSDIAIAYRNHQGELCLWLIEHKLTEKEFTSCGGYKSKGRQTRHDCCKTFTQLLDGPQSCYYTDACKFKYWEITQNHLDFFPNHNEYDTCPFAGGMNQLWRNQLLGLAIEQDSNQPYKHVCFSVVKHPRNTPLDATLTAYKKLVADNPKFFFFTSSDLVNVAERQGDADLNKWVGWYRELYNLG